MNFFAKVFYAGALLVATVAPVFAGAPTAADCFIDAPDSATPLLNRRQRLQLITYFNSSYDAPTKNVAGENTFVTAADSASVTVKIAPSATLQVAPVVCGRDTLAVYIETVELPQRDSNIKFYRLRDGSSFTPAGMPSLRDFINRKASKQNLELPPVFTAEAVYDPARKLFIFTNTAIDTIARPHDKTVMHTERQYRFNGKRFVAADGIK